MQENTSIKDTRAIQRLFYMNQVDTNCENDEIIIKTLIIENTKYFISNHKLTIITYYRNTRMKNLLINMKPITYKQTNKLVMAIVVYKRERYKFHDCIYFVGYTITTLSLWLTMQGTSAIHYTTQSKIK